MGPLQKAILLQISKGSIVTESLRKFYNAKNLGIKQVITQLENYDLLNINKDGINLTPLGEKHQFGGQSGEFDVENSIRLGERRL